MAGGVEPFVTAAALRVEPAPTELDAVTLARAKQGEPAALRALIELYQDRVYALVWRMLIGRAQHLTQDLAQETFVRVLRGIGSFDPRGEARLSTWILTIATRVVLNEKRREGRDRADPDDAAIATTAGAERTDHGLERARLAEALTAGLAALPDDQRAVFVLREYHELEYVEIATALELDLNTVRSRLHRARAALRTQLTAAGVEP